MQVETIAQQGLAFGTAYLAYLLPIGVHARARPGACARARVFKDSQKVCKVCGLRYNCMFEKELSTAYLAAYLGVKVCKVCTEVVERYPRGGFPTEISRFLPAESLFLGHPERPKT